MKIYVQFLIILCISTCVLSLSAINPAAVNKNSFAQQTKLKVTTSKITDINATQAKCSFTIQGTPISEKGVCFSDVPSPTISGKKSMAPRNPTNNGTSILVGLKANTKYFVRAYAKSGSEVFYGNELSFTTLSTEGDSKPTTGPKKESKSETPKK